MIGLLSLNVLLVLGVGGWRWMIWPDEVATRFVILVGNGQFEEANAMMTSPMHWAIVPGDAVALFDISGTPHTSPRDIWQARFAGPRPRFHPRTVSDLAYGRRRFRVEDVRFEFRVEWGRVSVRSMISDPTSFDVAPDLDLSGGGMEESATPARPSESLSPDPPRQ
jgi:hypothetical protein